MHTDLLHVLVDTRKLLALPDNDFTWSSWHGHDDALAELDAAIARLAAGQPPPSSLPVLFLPTGPLQEVALSSGWGQEFLTLADRFDEAYPSAGDAATPKPGS